MWFPCTVPSNTFECLSPAVSTSLTWMHYQYLAEYLRGSLWNSLEFSLCAVLSSMVLCPENSGCFGLFGISVLSPQLKESVKFCLDFLSLYCGLEALSRQRAGSYRAYFTCFSSGMLPLLYDIQYLKTTVTYILTDFLAVWVSMVNLIFVTPVIIYIIIIFKLNFALPQWRN